MTWNTEGEDSFPVGTFVRPDTSYGDTDAAGPIGRVIGARGRIVAVKFPASASFPFGPTNVPAEFAGPNVRAYDADWLHRVVFVSVRFYGPGMQPGRGEFHGARYVVSGTRGNRKQLTVPHDAASHGWNGDSNGANVAERFGREREDMCAPVAEVIRYRHGRNTSRVYAVTETGTCDCSDEYGPCEFHGDTLVTREGASMRTADELSHEFLSDVASVLGEWPSDEFRDADTRLGNALADNRSDYGASWFADPDDADELQDWVMRGESALADAGYSVWWDDGYRIVRVTGGPLA